MEVEGANVKVGEENGRNCLHFVVEYSKTINNSEKKTSNYYLERILFSLSTRLPTRNLSLLSFFFFFPFLLLLP